MVGEDVGALLAGEFLEVSSQPRSVEEVVAQDQGSLVTREESLRNEESLRQTLWSCLNCILHIHAPGPSITQESLEGARILRGGDDQDIAKPRSHQSAQGIVDHRLVVDREQLLTNPFGHWPQPAAGPTSEDDPLHAYKASAPSTEGIHARQFGG